VVWDQQVYNVLPDKTGMILHIIFDPQGRQDEAMHLLGRSLVIDGEPQPISPISKEIKNGWFNADYAFTAPQVAAIRQAQSLGVILQAAYGAPVFLGFDALQGWLQQISRAPQCMRPLKSSASQLYAVTLPKTHGGVSRIQEFRQSDMS
jgi:hypothetical protein